jgi:hypothetical protein
MAPTETNAHNLEKRPGKVCRQGYEMMDSLQTPGVSNLSVPVFGPNRTVIATLTCPYIKRLAPDRTSVVRRWSTWRRPCRPPAISLFRTEILSMLRTCPAPAAIASD